MVVASLFCFVDACVCVCFEMLLFALQILCTVNLLLQSKNYKLYFITKKNNHFAAVRVSNE